MNTHLKELMFVDKSWLSDSRSLAVSQSPLQHSAWESGCDPNNNSKLLLSTTGTECRSCWAPHLKELHGGAVLERLQ